MRLRRLLHSTAIAACIVALAAPPGLAAGPHAEKASQPAPGGMQVRLGQADGWSRIEFAAARGVTSKRDGQDLILTVAGGGDPDLALLNIHPPKFVKAAKAVRTPGGLSVRLTLDPGADAKVGRADGAVFVNVFAAASPPSSTAPAPPMSAQAAAPPVVSTRPDPRPPSGVIHVQSEAAAGQLFMHFAWAAPTGAAVFRRGEAVWVVFDTAAKLDLSKVAANSDFFRSMRVVEGDGYTALRIASSAAAVQAISQGATWTVALGNGDQVQPPMVQVARLLDSGPATLQASMAGSTKVVWIDDPVVGDRIAAVTALGPVKGLPSRREYIDMALLPSMQGLAVEPIAGDVQVVADTDVVRIGRPAGLNLSSPSASGGHGLSSAGLPQAVTLPAVIDQAGWAKTGSGGFLSRYDALQDAAAEEVDKEASSTKGGGPRSGTVAARMGLARFLIGSQLYFEAIGVMEMTAKSHPELLDNAEYRGLRGAAKVMAGRYKEAQIDLSAPALSDDPSAALWRGLVAADQGQWADARAAFQRGQGALNQFAPALQAKFARADADAALRLGNLMVAQTEIALALTQSKAPEDQLATRLIQARLFEAQGQQGPARAVYDAIARAPIDKLSTPATLHATQIRLARGSIKPAAAAAIFDGLRYRWRGDSTELEVIRALGSLYLSQGRYREAMEVLRSAGQRMPDDPEAMKLQADLQGVFRTLFMDGLADGMEPIQALALFYDFRELTPIGADGDLMVRKLARRLVDVDLLDRAAELLKYQADNRLDGVPRAQVATDLATIYLMNRQPEQAIQALNDSRTTILPQALTAERRLIEARAWLALNDVDHALELIGKDASPEASDLRAEISWRRKDWPAAAAAYEKAVGVVAGSLTPDQESKLLRAGVAFSLAQDGAGLERLRTRYGGVIDQAHSPDALKVALSPLNGDASPTTLPRLIAKDDEFAGWVAKMKQRFREKAAPVGTGTGPAKVAAAGGPAAG